MRTAGGAGMRVGKAAPSAWAHRNNTIRAESAWRDQRSDYVRAPDSDSPVSWWRARIRRGGDDQSASGSRTASWAANATSGRKAPEYTVSAPGMVASKLGTASAALRHHRGARRDQLGEAP